MKFKAGTTETCFINVPRIFLDGKDVTHQCNAFDSDEGWADVYEWEVEEKQFRVVTIGGNKTVSLVRMFGTITTDPPLPELDRTVKAVRRTVDHYENEKKEAAETFISIDQCLQRLSGLVDTSEIVKALKELGSTK